MTEAFDVLPGIALPVSEATERLTSMWEVDDPDFSLTFHASQMNVVLQFGLSVEQEHARECFSGLVRFAQRYPCRIIVLCPSNSGTENVMESKLFSQCYIGESHREMCCCEALILRYSHLEYESLLNQVSIWLEGDLPTYCWLNDAMGKHLGNYLNNMRNFGVRRFVFDRSEEWSELDALSRSEDFQINDLSSAFLLPVRQTVGQYLSRYSISDICDGLETVQILGGAGERHVLTEWVRSCLEACLERQKDIDCDPEFLSGDLGPEAGYLLEMKFIYKGKKHFIFALSGSDSKSKFEANLGRGEELACVPIKLLELEQALAEAFFFG